MRKKNDNSNSCSRRDLLKSGTSTLGGLAAFPPFGRIMELMLRDLTSKSHAEEKAGLFYMPIVFYGAPPRWTFDHFLATKESDLSKVIINPGAGNSLALKNGAFSESVYSTSNYKGVLVPPLWNYVAKTSKGSSKLTELLDHILVFRGYGTGVDGHLNNSAAQLAPIASLGSLSGIVGDQSETLFRVIQSTTYACTGYNSPDGHGLTGINYVANQNLITNLLNSFRKNPENQKLIALRDRHKTYFDQAAETLKALSKTSLAPQNLLTVDHAKALEKIESSMEDLNTVWSFLFEKYKTILLAAYKDRSQGITAQAVIVDSDSETGKIPWAIMAYPDHIYPQVGTDLRDSVNTVNVENLAAEFALAEYVATRGITSVFEMVLVNGPHDMIVPTSSTIQGGRLASVENRVVVHVFDEHSSGSASSIFYNSLMFRALSAAILELVQVLKEKNLFQKSFIQVVSDFGRLPRNTQAGSDHGFDSMVSSVFTGLNNSKPIVVGNILRDGSVGQANASYTGTFGQKASTRVNGTNVSLGPASVTSTLANIMNLNSNPWRNVAEPLITLKSGQLSVNASEEII